MTYFAFVKSNFSLFEIRRRPQHYQKMTHNKTGILPLLGFHENNPKILVIRSARVLSTGKKYVCQKDPEIFERETETSELVQYYYIVIIVINIVNIHSKIYIKIKFRFRGVFWELFGKVKNVLNRFI